MQHLNNGFNKFKLDDSTYVKMLIVQKMWKASLNHSSIIAKHCVFQCNFNKCKIQLVNNGFKILKVNGLIHVHMLIIEKMWKNIIDSF
jgi:hypothetical protein